MDFVLPGSSGEALATKPHDLNVTLEDLHGRGRAPAPTGCFPTSSCTLRTFSTELSSFRRKIMLNISNGGVINLGHPHFSS